MRYQVTHHCKRCSVDFIGRARTKGAADYQAEQAYNAHECRYPNGTPMPALSALSLEELRRLAYGETQEPTRR